MMPTADEVAVAIVTAARLLGADPIEALTGGPRSNYSSERHILATRARAYAASAMDKGFNGRHVYVPRPTLARLVGVSKSSWSCYFTSLEGRPKPWWDQATFGAVVSALQKAHAGRLDAPREVAPTPRPPAPQKPLARPVAPLETTSNGTATFEGLDRVAAGFGRPKDHEAGGDKQLIGRAEERRKLGDILVEAVRNTAKLQDKINEQ